MSGIIKLMSVVWMFFFCLY